MKLLVLLLLPCLCFAQKKNQNVIEIHGIDQAKAEEMFRIKGYQIASASPEYISTVPQRSENNIVIVFYLAIKDSVGILQGTYDGHKIVPHLWDFAESYAGKYKGGSYEKMHDLAQHTGRPLTYAKK